MLVVTIVCLSVFGAIVVALMMMWYLCVYRVDRLVKSTSTVNYQSIVERGEDLSSVISSPSRITASSPSKAVVKRSSTRRKSSSGSTSSFKGIAIGIDIGTVNTRFAVIENGRVRVIQNEHGENLTPTIVAAPGDDPPNSPAIVFGSVAQVFFKKPDGDVVSDLARRVANPTDVVDWQIFDTAPNGNQNTTTKLSPTVLTALFLNYIKSVAENDLKQPVTYAVIAVPTAFSDIQRQAFVDAAKIAGFSRVQLHSKIVLGGLYYMCNSYQPEEIWNYDGHTIAFRYGSGAMEAAVMELKRGAINVVASAGSQAFGGSDLSELMYLECLKKLNDGHFNVARNRIPLVKLRKECDKKKITLSAVEKVNIVAELNEGATKITFTRSELEALMKRLDDEIPRLFDRILAEGRRKCHLQRNTVGHVYLFGGCSRMPKVQRIVKDYFNGLAIIHVSSLDDHAVVEGAAIQAAFLAGQKVEGMLLTELREVSGSKIDAAFSKKQREAVVDSIDQTPITRQKPELVTMDNNFKLIQTFSDGSQDVSIDLNFETRNDQHLPAKVCVSMDKSGMLNLTTEPQLRLRKVYAMSKRKIAEKQQLLQKIADETEKRRQHVIEDIPVVDRIVRSVTHKNTDDHAGLLLGEDFVA